MIEICEQKLVDAQEARLQQKIAEKFLRETTEQEITIGVAMKHVLEELGLWEYPAAGKQNGA